MIPVDASKFPLNCSSFPMDANMRFKTHFRPTKRREDAKQKATRTRPEVTQTYTKQQPLDITMPTLDPVSYALRKAASASLSNIFLLILAACHPTYDTNPTPSNAPTDSSPIFTGAGSPRNVL
jgi:hypothetical protein